MIKVPDSFQFIMDYDQPPTVASGHTLIMSKLISKSLDVGSSPKMFQGGKPLFRHLEFKPTSYLGKNGISIADEHQTDKIKQFDLHQGKKKYLKVNRSNQQPMYNFSRNDNRYRIKSESPVRTEKRSRHLKLDNIILRASMERKSINKTSVQNSDTNHRFNSLPSIKESPSKSIIEQSQHQLVREKMK